MAHWYLGGPSINPHWNVPLALKSLLGELEVMKMVIEKAEPHMRQRVDAKEEHPSELGIQTSAILLTTHGAEIAIKTLIAQTDPGADPKGKRGTHGLHTLFERLDQDVQDEVRAEFAAIQAQWASWWSEHDIDVVFATADTAFVDWRYAMEPKTVSGGIPKGVFLAAFAVWNVGVRRLTSWQSAQRISPPR